MAVSKATGEIDGWLEIAATTGMREGAIQDVSGKRHFTLWIGNALITTTAQTIGTKITIEIRTDTGDAVDNWSVLTEFRGVTGTAVTLALDATEPAAETAIACTNPVTANMDNDGKFKFIEHGTDANSEIVYQTANSGDAGDTITIGRGGLAHEQTSSSALFDIDDADDEAVKEYPIRIPQDADAVRVMYHNQGASAVMTRCRFTNETGE